MCQGHRSENKYELEYTVKTGFTPEVTPRKSRVDGGWDLASPYICGVPLSACPVVPYFRLGQKRR